MPSTRFVLNTNGWATVCERAVLADSPASRLRGLIGRRELPSGEGLLLDPCTGIHTSFMRFPIDALFLDSDIRVVRIETLRPWRAISGHRTRIVLELAAGEAARRGVSVGDQLLLMPQDPAFVTGDEPATAPATTRRRDRRQRDSAEEAPPVSMSVLVASSDRRFRTVVSTLLERRGCRVDVLEDPTVVAGRAGDTSPDVVVLDADRALADPVLAAAALGAASPETGVVLVGDGAQQRPGHPPVRDKWGRFDDLFAAIDDAYWHRGARKQPV